MVASEQHRRAERRLLPPRRSESERRLGERRLQVISLDEERRDQTERRRATDRRQPTGRRQPEAHTSELQSLTNIVCRLLLEKTTKTKNDNFDVQSICR